MPAPGLRSTRGEDDLLLARIEERPIHFLAKRGTSMDGLHEANVLQKTDLVHGAQLGLVPGHTRTLRVEKIKTVLGERHPEAQDRGLDPPIPIFP
jgi:hypothetical protein